MRQLKLSLGDSKNFHPLAYGGFTWGMHVRYDNKFFHPLAYGGMVHELQVKSF